MFERSLTNVPKVGGGLLRAFYKSFYLWFCDSSDQYRNVRDIFT